MSSTLRPTTDDKDCVIVVRYKNEAPLIVKHEDAYNDVIESVWRHVRLPDVQMAQDGDIQLTVCDPSDPEKGLQITEDVWASGQPIQMEVTLIILDSDTREGSPAIKQHEGQANDDRTTSGHPVDRMGLGGQLSLVCCCYQDGYIWRLTATNQEQQGFISFADHQKLEVKWIDGHSGERWLVPPQSVIEKFRSYIKWRGACLPATNPGSKIAGSGMQMTHSRTMLTYPL
ncbi:hypothetical protein OF83DRAFT_1084746 [Amylostereum chailletii]|nr:hypothetical protein OF83DRAFT_1084746 [Amylostereum chailletii]